MNKLFALHITKRPTSRKDGTETPTEDSPNEKDGIVLLHGILRHGFSMKPLGRFLEKQGYKILNVEYPSTNMPIEKVVDRIHPEIEKFAKTVHGKVHFVGFSMGGLVIRAYQNKYPTENIGRSVMVGPPHSGSEVAEKFKNNGWYKKVYGPAGNQLGTSTNFNALLGPIGQEVGIIAGAKKVGRMSARLIPGPSDGQVSVESTKIEGMQDHITITGGHSFLTRNHQVWYQVLHFLQHGKFLTTQQQAPSVGM